jgi:hypothetical protein
MPGLFSGVLSSGSGILSRFTSNGGMLSQATGPLQARLATLQAAGTPKAKITALTGTLGTRLKTIGGSGGLLAGLGAAGSSAAGSAAQQAAQMQAAMQAQYAASAQRQSPYSGVPKGVDYH